MKYPKNQVKYTSIESVKTYEGESIEDKVLRITKNNEPIEDTAPLIYTEKKDGVLPQYDIRTDKWEVAQQAMDEVNKTRITKVVFLASIIDYFEHPKPDVNFYIKEYNSEHQSFTDIESAYRKFYKNSVEHQKQIIL